MIPTIPISLAEFKSLKPDMTLKNFVIDDYDSIKKGYDFKSIVVFGDSLSDNGNYMIFMAGPPSDMKYFHEYFSEYYTGKQSTPARLGGQNYAKSWTAISLDANKELTTRAIINQYLSQYNGKIDKDKIYILWAGGNNMYPDVFKETANAILL